MIGRTIIKFAGVLLGACLASSSAISADGRKPLVSIGFEELTFDQATELVRIKTQFNQPDVVPGVAGHAWRTDGFSSWASVPVDLSESDGFTVSAWIALESYPSDLERPVTELSPSSIFQQAEGARGFDLFIDTYGRWGLWLATTRGEVRLETPGRFPLWKWTQVTVSVDNEAGTARLYLDAELVAQTNLKPGSRFRPAAADLQLARSPKELEMLNFIVNRLNGAYDEVVVYGTALSDAGVRELHASYGNEIPDAESALIVPESRFADDFLRPRFHAMPPANWTNEPHGMVRRGDTWHLFYQRTPNGPYKTQMHWGHMASDDLVTWRHLPDALWPELQDDRFGFDMKGIWSGDVIHDGGLAFAFYTSVNHSDRLLASNPGISMAVSTDRELKSWEKKGPIINSRYVRDFRDPYLWREGNSWHMIIGAALKSGGGLDYYVLETKEGVGDWVHRERFAAVPYHRIDVGSIIWEMPVFEPLTDEVHILLVNPIGGKVSKYGDPATRAVYWTGRWEEGLFHPFFETPRPLDLVPGHLSPAVERAADGVLRAIGIVDERRSPQAQEDAGWAHTFSVPRTWRLLPDGQTLGQAPAPELKALRGAPIARIDARRLANESVPVAEGQHAYEVEVSVDEIGSGAQLGLDILAAPDNEEFTRLYIDSSTGALVLDKSRSTRSEEEEGPRILRGLYDPEAFGSVRTLRAFVDGSVVDVFINDAAAFSFRTYPTRQDSTEVRLFVDNGIVELAGVTLWPLQQPR